MGCNSSTNLSDDTETSTDSAALPGEGISVVPAYATLEERFQTEIVNIGLENLGYDIESIREVDYTALFLDMSNENITFTPAHWSVNQAALFENSGGDEALERSGSIIEDSLQGYMIDKATADEYGITSIEQLSDPELAALFDTDGDGKANLIGCDAGWLCASIIDHHIQEYGLSDTVQQVQGKYVTLLADVTARYDQGQPVLYYTYTPFWLQNVLSDGEEVEWLSVPYTSLPEGQGDDLTASETTVDGENLGFAVQDQMIVANQAFVDQNPAAAKFFELVKVSIADVNAQNQLIREGEDSPEQIRNHAEAWVEENQAQFDDWIEASQEAQ
ncbi:MAG: glycine betaine/L-proline ABC transporter substrate-binding protein ProX [Leptolyngbyaceae cyanobacterium]